MTRGRDWKARFARLMGRCDWADDGRCEVPLGQMLLNLVVQRLFRVNASCKYPVHFTSTVVAGERLVVGKGVAKYLAMSGGLYIQAINGVEIGDRSMIAPGVKIISANHSGPDRWISAAPVRIGSDCWIGANAVILPGVTVGDGAVVGAGAVVTDDVEAATLVVGVPARARRV